MRLTTVLRRLLGVTRMHVEGVHIGRSGSLTVSAPPSWRRSRCGVCERRRRGTTAAGAVVAACVVGSAVGVGSVCAVAGVVPTLRGAGGGGVVGGAGQHVHGDLLDPLLFAEGLWLRMNSISTPASVATRSAWLRMPSRRGCAH